MGRDKKCSPDYEIQELDTYKIKASHACLKNLDAKKIETKNLTIANVNVTDILGKQVNTGITSTLDLVTDDPNSLFGKCTPKYLPEYNVNKEVFDTMLQKAYEVVYSVPPNAEGLEYRLTQGRERLGLPSPSVVRLLGSITFAPWVQTIEGNDEFVNYLTNASWNLQCANTQVYIDGVKPNPATVAVYVQYGYIDKVTNVCRCEVISLGINQLDPTIDYNPDLIPSETDSWGELFIGTKVLDSIVIDNIYENMPDPKSTGGIQLLFFAEEQVEVFRLNPCGDERSTNVTVIECGNGCTIGVDQNATFAVGSRVARRVGI